MAAAAATSSLYNRTSRRQDSAYNREANGSDLDKDYRKPSVHERLMNYETKSLRPFYRRTDPVISEHRPALQLDHVK